jgi:hypothetical protein
MRDNVILRRNKRMQKYLQNKIRESQKVYSKHNKTHSIKKTSVTYFSDANFSCSAVPQETRLVSAKQDSNCCKLLASISL